MAQSQMVHDLAAVVAPFCGAHDGSRTRPDGPRRCKESSSLATPESDSIREESSMECSRVDKPSEPSLDDVEPPRDEGIGQGN